MKKVIHWTSTFPAFDGQALVREHQDNLVVTIVGNSDLEAVAGLTVRGYHLATDWGLASRQAGVVVELKMRHYGQVGFATYLRSPEEDSAGCLYEAFVGTVNAVEAYREKWIRKFQRVGTDTYTLTISSHDIGD